jgi:ABC-2 type transport system ATP-binding protein
MRINTHQLAKRFRNEWIVKNVNLNFDCYSGYAITGPNGTGKSTLLKLLSGHLTPSKGHIEYSFHQSTVSNEDIYRYVAFAAPYIDLIEEFTLLEAIQFHQKFSPLPDNLLHILNFHKASGKQIRHFSSGMKQRLKLALAICSNRPILLLDEPSTNLDRQGVDWFLNLLDNYKKNRLLIIASNVPEDLVVCDQSINILDFKSA